MMRLFKVYIPKAGHELVLAKTPRQAADIAQTVRAEAGTPCHQVNVVELCLPDGDVGLVYEPCTTPTVYLRPKKEVKP